MLLTWKQTSPPLSGDTCFAGKIAVAYTYLGGTAPREQGNFWAFSVNLPGSTDIRAPFETHDEAKAAAEAMVRRWFALAGAGDNRDAVNNRTDLIAALKRLETAAQNRDSTTGDLCRLLDVKAELLAAAAAARDAIAKAEGQS